MDTKPVLFTDLDGTIREPREGEFIDGVDDISILPHRNTKLEEYRDEGYLLIAITNQGGVACGYKDRDQAHHEIKATEAQLGLQFDAYYIAFYHPDGDDEGRYMWRKPRTGMISHATESFARHSGVELDIPNSLLVGDRDEDRECARRAEIEFHDADDFFSDT